jgi:hypothetical protein
MVAVLLRKLAALSLDDLQSVQATLATFTHKDWQDFIDFQTKKRQQPHTADDIVITCDVCADQSYWDNNGGKVAQWLACGPLGLGCTNF